MHENYAFLCRQGGYDLTIPSSRAGGNHAMPTYATDQELDRLEVEREAWSAYRTSLVDLEGKQYEEAEAEAWDLLQRRLTESAR
jgi:hypothetical protein